MYYLYDRRRRHLRSYTEQFFTSVVDNHAEQSAPVIARTLVEEFHPRTVLDVGCGTGSLLKAFAIFGVEILGLEYSEIGLRHCRSRKVPVLKFDLERDTLSLPRDYDLVISTEVAEHLQERFANRYVQMLSKCGRIIVFTAATPGQGGLDHVNEQPHQYWIQKFQEQNFEFLEESALQLRASWKASGVTWWYHQNLMLFRKHGKAAL